MMPLHLTSQQMIGTALSSTALLLGIWFGLTWLYRDYCIEAFRQGLFALRDELFDYAASGAISFDAPAYAQLRSTMNGLLRFGHRFDAVSMIAFSAIVRPALADVAVANYAKRWEANLGQLSPEVRARLENFRKRMHECAGRHALRASPLFTLVVFCVLLPIALLFGARNAVRSMARVTLRPRIILREMRRRWLEQIDTAAFDKVVA